MRRREKRGGGPPRGTIEVVFVPPKNLQCGSKVGSSSLFSKCLLYSVVRFVMGVSSRPFSDSYDSVPFLLSILNARAKIISERLWCQNLPTNHRIDIASSDKAHNIDIARVQLLGGTEA